MGCLWCASHSVTHVMPAVALVIATLGNYYSVFTREKWNSRRGPSFAQGHNLEVELAMQLENKPLEGALSKH